MKHKSILIYICILIIAFAFPYSALGEEIKDKKEIILIDPGHGGIDGGAVSKDGTLEKDLNLQIALKLRDKLQYKYNVIMTREKDEGLYHEGKSVREKKIEDLARRSKLQDETGCTIFISIHQNMFTQTKYTGAQVWYASNEQSKRLAENMQSTLKEELDSNNNRKCKGAQNMYKILRGNRSCAAIIIECGFMSNYEENNKLKSCEYQEKIANAIANGVEKYIKEKENLEN